MFIKDTQKIIYYAEVNDIFNVSPITSILSNTRSTLNNRQVVLLILFNNVLLNNISNTSKRSVHFTGIATISYWISIYLSYILLRAGTKTRCERVFLQRNQESSTCSEFLVASCLVEINPLVLDSFEIDILNFYFPHPVSLMFFSYFNMYLM